MQVSELILALSGHLAKWGDGPVVVVDADVESGEETPVVGTSYDMTAGNEPVKFVVETAG